MDRLSYETQGTNTYLVYSATEEDAIDTMSLGMLTNNKIPGLAQAIFTQMDTTKFIKYNVSSHISVKQFFSGPVNKKRLIGVFNGIVDAMLSAEDYMIDTNSIIMDLDYIFADVSTCETVLICLPVIDTEMPSTDMGLFFKNIMFGTQFDQTENCDHIAKIMNYLNSSPVFSLADFKELLNSIDSTATTPIVNKPQPAVTPQVKPVQQPVQQAPVSQAAETQPLKTEPVKPVQKSVPKAEPIPQRIPSVPQPNSQPVDTAKDTPKMSWFYLMQHYNKENAAAYKAQKEAKKNGSAAPQPMAPPKATVKTPPQPSNVGYAIPGQPEKPNMGFAIPGQPAQPIQTAQPVQPVQPAQPVQTNITPEPLKQTYQAPAMPQGRAMNFGETTVLGGGKIGETTVLTAMPATNEVNPHLIRTKTGEKISLNKPVFRIGKEKSYVDYFIGDNTAVSRSHANIVVRDGEYFAVDTNSTNHTYVNGQMLQSNVETKINHGDRIKLANEEFEFKLH